MPTQLKGQARVDGQPTFPSAMKANGWQVCHTDLEAAAETTALVQPLGTTNAGVLWVKVPDGAVRAQFRVRYGSGATVTTSPVLRVFGFSGVPSADEGSTLAFSLGAATPVSFPERLDTVANSTGTTITLDGTNDVRDGTYQWSQPMSSPLDGNPWIDLRGNRWVAALVETAANVSGIIAQCEIKFLN